MPSLKPIRVDIEVDVRPSRRAIAWLGSMVGFVLFLIAVVFVVHGCYDAKDPTLPDCQRFPLACGGYPAARWDGGK